MATIVCQSQMMESRTLRLKFSAPNPTLSLELAIKSSFLDSKSPQSKEEAYVHLLSRHSLEMCTETLGSETGSDDGALSFSEAPRKQRQALLPRRGSVRRNLPPPLTTLTGPECVRIQTRREDGRMVMDAVKGPSTQTCFRSERTNGRLRLFIFSTQNQHLHEDHDVGCQREDFEMDPLQRNETEVNGEEEGRVGWLRGSDGNNLKVKGKMGNELLQSPRRCNEGCEKWEAYRALTST